MKKILLPTDFSEISWNAIQYIVQLFKDVTCEFYLLNTYVPIIYDVEYVLIEPAKKGLIDAVRENSVSSLKKIEARINEEFNNPNHSIKRTSSFNNLVPEINTIVQNERIELIVMGTKGATGAKEIFFGTNTVHAIKNVNCPILVIPDKFDFKMPTQIAFPSDFNRFYSAVELRELKNIAHLCNSKIRIVHINEENKLNDVQEYNITMLKSYFKELEHSFHWMPDFTKKAKAISTFIEDLEIDMLAMVKYKHSIIENIMHEHVINKIGYHTTVPFLVIPDLS